MTDDTKSTGLAIAAFQSVAQALKPLTNDQRHRVLCAVRELYGVEAPRRTAQLQTPRKRGPGRPAGLRTRGVSPK